MRNDTFYILTYLGIYYYFDAHSIIVNKGTIVYFSGGEWKPNCWSSLTISTFLHTLLEFGFNCWKIKCIET